MFVLLRWKPSALIIIGVFSLFVGHLRILETSMVVGMIETIRIFVY